VTYAAAGLARNSATAATSWGRPMRPRTPGLRAASCQENAGASTRGRSVVAPVATRYTQPVDHAPAPLPPEAVASSRAAGSGIRTVGAVALAALVFSVMPARAEVRLPPGFAKEVYVTGQGFAIGRGARGIPATSTLVFDRSGGLYLARTGARYQNTEADDLLPVYRVLAGGGRFTPETESRYLYGPPLRNPQTVAVRAGFELFVTTFDRDRRLGVLYRVIDGRAELFAGGTPPRAASPLLRQPEGVAVDSSGLVYVADREAGIVLRLDPAGRVLDPRYAVVRQPRVLAMDATDALWIGADGDAEAPWQQGPGEIWRVPRDGPPVLVLRGPIPAAIAVSAGGHLYVADRQGGELFALTADGRRIPFLTYTEGDAPRGLAFAPDTPETRRAGIAGDLFVVTIHADAWPVNEVVRITGPFDEMVRQRAAALP
jgi:DNA-binding beta-propeller fold protein YncE